MKKLKWFVVIIVTVTLLIGGRFPLYYQLEPVSVIFVDADTEEPIAGVSALVYWKMVQSSYSSSVSFSGSIGGHYAGSDEQGRLSVPGLKPYWLQWFSSRRITEHTPTIKIIKSGYVPEMLSIPGLVNEYQKSYEKNISFYGKQVIAGATDLTIKLKKLPVNAAERYKKFHKTFAFPITNRSCQETDLIKAGYLENIYQEQFFALQAGIDLDLDLSDEEKSQIINFKTPTLAACLALAKILNQEKF